MNMMKKDNKTYKKLNTIQITFTKYHELVLQKSNANIAQLT